MNMQSNQNQKDLQQLIQDFLLNKVEPHPIDRVLRINDVCKMTGLSKATIYRLMKQSLFPRQFKIGIESVGWRESDLVKFINKRASQNA